MQLPKILLLTLPALALMGCQGKGGSTAASAAEASAQNINHFREARLSGTMAFVVGNACESQGVSEAVSYVRLLMKKIIDDRPEIDADLAGQLTEVVESNFINMNQKPRLQQSYHAIERNLHQLSMPQRIEMCRDTINSYLSDFQSSVSKLN